MKLNQSHPSALPRASFLPYPELVESEPHEGPWLVADSNDQHWLPTNGATDKAGKRVYVPLEPGGEGVSLHEMAHVRWSPLRFPRVRFPIICLQAVEDARINLALSEIELPFTLDREQRAYVAHLAARDAKSGDFASTILRAVASLGTQAAPIMREEVEALPRRAREIAMRWLVEVEERLVRARARLGGPVAPFRIARDIARDLAADLKAHGLLDRKDAPRNIGCCHVLGAVEEGALDRGPDDEGLRLYERMIRRRRGRGSSRGLEAGRMRIARPPLALRQPSVLEGGVARRSCRTEGTQITRPDRYALDRAIFGRKGRGGGGTILLDASGSMSISAEEVEEIVRAAGGAAVVAMYSGKADVGELRIIASGDRRVTNDFLEPFGSGNIVDLPALEWLAKQPTPRIWISDGRVTGVGDDGCDRLLDRCRGVVARGRVERFKNAEAALEAMA